jgi:DNA polymerase I-like protein with 3'-5' exonuclease and polymerase domains
MMKAVAAAESSGAASTLMGRRRPIPGLASADFQERSAAERKVVNSQIQVGGV